MTTRRDLLKVPPARPASPSAAAACSTPRGRSSRGAHACRSMVNGKRVKTIDVHAHCLFHEAVKLMGDDAAGFLPPVKGAARALHRARRAPQGDGRHGDRHGGAVDQPVLVPQGARPRRRDRPGAEREAGRALRVAPRPLRRLRLAGAAVSRSGGAAARRRAMKKQGLKGAAIGGNVAGEDFADPNSTRSGPRRKSLARCCSSIRRHAGARQAPQGQRLAGQHDRQPARHDDRAVAPDLRGHARPLPGLKIISAHGGGFLPSYAPRSDHACFVSPPDCSSDSS